MKIVYTPRDNPIEGREEIPVDLDDLWVGEVKLLEKVMKETIGEFGQAMERGSFTHMMALMWIYRRRTNLELRLDDIDETIRVSELEPVLDDDEIEGSGEVDPKAIPEEVAPAKAKAKPKA